MPDQRQFFRYSTSIPVKFINYGSPMPVYLGTVVNLSAGGCRIFAKGIFNNAINIIMTIYLPDNVVLDLIHGRVIYYEPVGEGFYVGVMFVNIDLNTLRSITDYLHLLEEREKEEKKDGKG